MTEKTLNHGVTAPKGLPEINSWVPFPGATDVARRPYTTVLTSHVPDALSKMVDR